MSTPVCDYAGCPEQAVYKMTQKMGKKGSTHCCSGCAPSWVTACGEAEAFEKTGRSFWTVEKIQ